MLPVAIMPQFMIDGADAVLQFFAENAGVGYGIGIILLTFATRIAILPLSVRQLKSMRALQAYTPQIKELNERYKDDPQRKQRELMAFYKENQINPLASCFPLLLQLPVFITLFDLLRSEGFKSEVFAYTDDPGFLFIPDLTDTAKGGVLIALLIIYFVSMVASMAISAAQAEGAQRVLLFALPVIFTPFIIGFPAGLILYWITTNFWTIGQQWVVKVFWPAPPIPTLEEVKATRPPPPPPRKKKKRR